MSNLVALAPAAVVDSADQRSVTHGVSWAHFEAQLALRGDRPVPRMAFLRGALELMSPSKDHERIKGLIGRLIEAYALEVGVDLSPYGGWTLKSPAAEAGIEADECYLIGDQSKAVPDLAIEVVWTSGGIDKLEIYRRLGVAEVWFWREGRLEVYLLRGGRFERGERSALFPAFDLALLVDLLRYPTALQAVKALRQSIRS